MLTSDLDRPGSSAPAIRHAPITSSDGLLRTLLEATISRGVETRFEVDGGSMLPLIRPRDIVHVRATGRATLRRGDVVAVRGAGETGLLVHRAVTLRDDEFTLRGDNCPRADGRYPQEQVIGVVVRVERHGRPVWFGSGRWGWLVALAARTGLVWRVNRIIYGARRRGVACLKFALADTRLRERKGEDGKE